MDVDAAIVLAAKSQQLDPRLVKAIVRVESNFNPRVVSPKGAAGLMQLMPATQARWGVTDPFDPEQNVTAGAKEFKRLLGKYGGDERLALAAYNAGEGAVAKYGGVPPYPETQEYVAKVQAAAASPRQSSAGASSATGGTEQQPRRGSMGTGGSIAESLGAQILDDSIRMVDAIKSHWPAAIAAMLGDDEIEQPEFDAAPRRADFSATQATQIEAAHVPRGMPCQGRMSSAYGNRMHPIQRRVKFHFGEDIAAPEGTMVRATADGRVARARHVGGYGNFVEVVHGTYRTRYAHLSAIHVREGDPVNRGDVLGAVGQTGLATGAHLHYEVLRAGRAQQPDRYLRDDR